MMSSKTRNDISTNDSSENDLSDLPMRAMRDIPEPKEDAKQITGLVKESGKVTGYQLSDGVILNKDEGVKLAREGGILGVGISERKGNEYLKSLPDDSEDNNLGNLPTVKN